MRQQGHVWATINNTEMLAYMVHTTDLDVKTWNLLVHATAGTRVCLVILFSVHWVAEKETRTRPDRLVLLCRAKRQHMLTFKVSRCCILALHAEALQSQKAAADAEFWLLPFGFARQSSHATGTPHLKGKQQQLIPGFLESHQEVSKCLKL